MLRVRNLRARGVEVPRLDLVAGACLALMGPSGSGKSRALRAIVDLDPNDGEVVADGIARESVSGPAWRRLVGYLPAEAGWWADTVGAHMGDPDRATALLAEVGLAAEALGWPVARLSTGERQRLALVRLLVGNPAVLLLDEPTAALDEAARALVEALLLRRLAAGRALVMVTHDRAQAERLAAAVLPVAAGRLGDPIRIEPANREASA